MNSFPKPLVLFPPSEDTDIPYFPIHTVPYMPGPSPIHGILAVERSVEIIRFSISNVYWMLKALSKLEIVRM
jgi:hypothetical protein